MTDNNERLTQVFHRAQGRDAEMFHRAQASDYARQAESEPSITDVLLLLFVGIFITLLAAFLVG